MGMHILKLRAQLSVISWWAWRKRMRLMAEIERANARELELLDAPFKWCKQLPVQPMREISQPSSEVKDLVLDASDNVSEKEVVAEAPKKSSFTREQRQEIARRIEASLESMRHQRLENGHVKQIGRTLGR